MQSPLPMRDGINPSRLYLPEGPWVDLYSFLIFRFPHLDPAVLRARLAAGFLVNENGLPMHLLSAYRPKTWLWYYREVPQETKVPFALTILYEDERLLVVDKPHFLASVPGGRYLKETALSRLRQQFDNPEISPIHRLDRDTAGVLIFCVDAHYRGAYQSLFQARHVKKTYEAIAPTRADLKLPMVYQSLLQKSTQHFTMRESNGIFNSQTEISYLNQGAKFSHYKLEPLTGKKHQLRAHMSALGIPICNDNYYPQFLTERADDDFSRPLQLLARSIEFIDPVSQQVRYFESRRQLMLKNYCMS